MMLASDFQSRDLRRAVLWMSVVLFGLLLVRTAWLSDDAYITFRTVDNALNGYGLRWNVSNRVQAYTHPLWMFVMTGAVALTGEVYFTALVLCVVLSLAAATIVATGIADSVPGAVVAVSILALSKAFVDYSTSGLENPLTHLLLAAFFAAYFWYRSARRVFVLGLLAALAMLNRLDIALIVGPSLAVAAYEDGLRRSIRPLLAAFTPLIAWEIFSVVYYGFPFPNTAYSKLQTGIPTSELLYQGVLYLLDSLGSDPLTLTAIAAAILTPFVLPAGRAIPLGLALYVGYTVWIGGDFMSGRFLAAPLLCAAVQIARQPLPRFDGAWATVAAVIWVLGMTAPRPTVASDAEYGADIEKARIIAPTGITDERRYYYPESGLLTTYRGSPRPNHKWITMGHELRASGERFFYTDASGFIGYAAGPGVHFVDKYGLGDPLIARLPASTPWRIGHFLRPEPEGYRETILSGRNVIKDPGMAAYYERLRVITEGPIWSARRWRAIVSMNLGGYERYLADYGIVRKQAEEVSGTPAAPPVGIGLRGMEVALPGEQRVRRVEIGVSRNDNYTIVLMRGGREAARLDIDQVLTADGGMTDHELTLNEPANADRIRVIPSGGDSRYVVGHLRVRP